MNESALKQLRDYLASPDPQLAKAALLIAQTEYPELSIDECLRQLDTIANQVWQSVALSDPPNLVKALNQVLFEDLGFRGNDDDYYNPKNSFLNEVLSQRLGIPISLSILYMEIGQRVGLPLEAVSFPGHFLVKLPLNEKDIFIIDPFSCGEILTEETLLMRLRQHHPQADESDLADALESTRLPLVLMRLLRNLQGIYQDQHAWHKLLNILNCLLIIEPEEPSLWRERAELYARLECARAALGDYQHYLILAPDAPDLPVIQAQLIQLSTASQALH